MEEGRMSVDSDDGEMIINEIDGLPSLHQKMQDAIGSGSRGSGEGRESQGGNDGTSGASASPSALDDLINDEDLPTSLIVTNLDNQLFKNNDLKKEIELLFCQFGEPVSFQYFRSFRRMRVNFASPANAAKARISLHQTVFLNTIINCYFAQPVTPIDSADQHLQPPALTKQFLISPPASPPVGWEPRDEGEPLVNYDLLAAIANLTPGTSHEIHAPSDNQPGIVVHVCEEKQLGASNGEGKQLRIAHTRCPQHN